jgi:NADH:ubiquinone oxidoreductase subunit 6 (subunit J)
VPIPDSVPIIGASWGDVLFVILAGTLIGSALLVVTLRDIIRSGLAMILAFGALAGIYVMLGAPLVAAAQVIVYIGAIAVLILFAVMLTQAKNAPVRLVFQTQAIPAAVAAIVLAVVVALSVTATDWGEAGARIATGTQALARLLFTDYVLPLEVVSVLLLAAVIGGVYLAKREDRDA